MERSEVNACAFVNLSETLMEAANRVTMEAANRVTMEELSKLQRDIIQEGINKKILTSDSEVDSDDELVMKFVKPKKKGGNDFETTAYAFALNNKMSKIRSELARTEERIRYLQLDYNNIQIKNDEYKSANINLKSKNLIITLENKKIIQTNSQTVWVLLLSLTLNGIFFMNFMIDKYTVKLQFT